MSDSISKTVKELLRAGVVAKDYAKGPIGRNSFCLGIQPIDKGIVRVWEGTAEIEAFIDPKFRQAVLNVQEKPRTVTRKVEYVWTGTVPPDIPEMQALLRANFPVTLPHEAQYSIDNLAVEKRIEKSVFTPGRLTRYILSGRVTGTVNSVVPMTFLTGFDEKYHFISALPKKVTSVEEAHDVLRGDVPLGAVRQGEWFFTPVSQELSKELTLYNVERYGYCEKSCRDYHFRACRAALEAGSSHHVDQMLLYRNAKYVFGHVYDNRQRHHKPLFLKDWHLVTRNREVTVPMTTALNRQRMQRWD